MSRCLTNSDWHFRYVDNTKLKKIEHNIDLNEMHSYVPIIMNKLNYKINIL